MNLNVTQVLAILIAVLGVVSGSTAQLTDLLGQSAAHNAASAASFLSSILSAIVLAVSGQASQVKAVQAMLGVDKIVVNSQANSTLASLAVDPQQDKIEAAPGAERAVKATAAAS